MFAMLFDDFLHYNCKEYLQKNICKKYLQLLHYYNILPNTNI